ncbi:helix-turn-helix transcriptional regulator [Rhodospirillaceae bacterium KN72]|uniref:Helix-turn-helix transcriptional regulator n=1 Tax=Pacificispira spongiicola TaxID=2729598 RepID=A0A7Y0E3G6_9PROT|nr:helix-turn-helix transcriptional regulator [Pacificispira spongiicola]NMM46498.1 helix-turn-helix transcriptional regulator [Pacificispira spongiicola]
MTKRMMSEIDYAVGSRLRLRREEAGLSREAFAEETGVAVETLRDYELGFRKMRNADLRTFADRLGVEIRWFLDGIKFTAITNQERDEA